jgi:hypothetical protein
VELSHKLLQLTRGLGCLGLAMLLLCMVLCIVGLLELETQPAVHAIRWGGRRANTQSSLDDERNEFGLTVDPQAVEHLPQLYIARYHTTNLPAAANSAERVTQRRSTPFELCSHTSLGDAFRRGPNRTLSYAAETTALGHLV